MKPGTGDVWYITGDLVEATASSYTEYDMGIYAVNTAFVQAHGLAALPKLVQVWYKCTTTQAGYAVDDRINAASTGDGNTNSSTATVSVNTTNVRVATGNNAAPQIIPAAGGTGVALTPSSWHVIIGVTS
jgi:hypothetical protein